MTAAGTRPRAILFDWDNTLVDTWPAITEALNAARGAFGFCSWSEAEAKNRVRRSLRDSFAETFGERWEEARDIFYRKFSATHLSCLREMPDATAVLSELATGDLYLGVVSNKQGTFLRKEAAHLGWERHFRRLVGATDARRDKPAPDPVLMALEPGRIGPGTDVWFVGDTALDMQCAYGVGVVPVLVRAEAPPPEENEQYQRFPPVLAFSGLAALAAHVRAL